jgi:hypothetical protein
MSETAFEGSMLPLKGEEWRRKGCSARSLEGDTTCCDEAPSRGKKQTRGQGWLLWAAGKTRDRGQQQQAGKLSFEQRLRWHGVWRWRRKLRQSITSRALSLQSRLLRLA